MLRELLWLARLARKKETIIMTTVQDVDDQVDALDNDLTSLSGGINTLAAELADQHQELLDAINANDPAALQAVADKLANTQQTVSDLGTAVQTAIDANPDPVPDAPAPAPGDGDVHDGSTDPNPDPNGGH